VVTGVWSVWSVWAKPFSRQPGPGRDTAAMHASAIWILARGRLEVWPRGLALRPPWLCGTRALTAITLLTSFQLAAAEFREPQWCDLFTAGQEGYPAPDPVQSGTLRSVEGLCGLQR
jgi:hypothetical protein